MPLNVQMSNSKILTMSSIVKPAEQMEEQASREYHNNHTRFQSRLLLLINPNTTQIEEGLLESPRLEVDTVNTCSGATRLAIYAACPVATQRQVDNDTVLIEMPVQVAIVGGEESSWLAPIVGVSGICTKLHLLRNGGIVSRPEPDLDVAGRALDRIPSSTCLVECRAIALWLREQDGAAAVPVDSCVAVLPFPDTSHCLAGRRHDASRSGVERRSVGTLVVHTLQDIELTTRRPVGANLPDRGPGPTALGHMFHIEDRNMLSKRLLAPDPHTISTGTVGVENGGEICAEDKRVRRWSNCELLLDGSVLVYIVYSTMCWIGEIFEVEIIKEVLTRIVTCLAVLITSCGDECLTRNWGTRDCGVGEAGIGLDRARDDRAGGTRIGARGATIEPASSIALFSDDRTGTQSSVKSTAATGTLSVVGTRAGDVLSTRGLA